MERSVRPRISIVMPSYNAAQYIEESIRSVQDQTLSDWELLVVDDSSTDATRDVVQGLAATDTRIHLLQLTSNSGGPARPRNVGLDRARGSWVAFLDADDLWHKDKLNRQMQVARVQGADLVCSSMQDFQSGMLRFPSTKDGLDTDAVRSISYVRMLCKNVIPTSSVVCQKQCITDVGGFDEAPELVAVEDYDLWLRVIFAGSRACKIMQPLLQYRITSQSLSRSKVQMLRKVARVMFRRTKADNKWLMPWIPFFLCYYMIFSMYNRVFKKSL